MNSANESDWERESWNFTSGLLKNDFWRESSVGKFSYNAGCLLDLKWNRARICRFLAGYLGINEILSIVGLYSSSASKKLIPHVSKSHLGMSKIVVLLRSHCRRSLVIVVDLGLAGQSFSCFYIYQWTIQRQNGGKLGSFHLFLYISSIVLIKLTKFSFFGLNCGLFLTYSTKTLIWKRRSDLERGRLVPPRSPLAVPYIRIHIEGNHFMYSLHLIRWRIRLEQPW